jgi:hypothetical protein
MEISLRARIGQQNQTKVIEQHGQEQSKPRSAE